MNIPDTLITRFEVTGTTQYTDPLYKIAKSFALIDLEQTRFGFKKFYKWIKYLMMKETKVSIKHL